MTSTTRTWTSWPVVASDGDEAVAVRNAPAFGTVAAGVVAKAAGAAVACAVVLAERPFRRPPHSRCDAR